MALGVTIAIDNASDVLLKDIVIDGYNNNVAIAVRGTRPVLINPTLINPYAPTPAPDDDAADADPEPDGGGIRVTGGTGFRCHGGSVEGGGDAALQFSSATTPPADISDGAYLDTFCTAIEGRLMLVGTHEGALTHLRFTRVHGVLTGGGEGLRLQNRARETGFGPSPVRSISVRDTAIEHSDTATPDYSIAIRNDLTDPGVTFDIRLDNVTVFTPQQSGLVVFTDGGDASSDLSWIAGGVVSTSAVADEPALDLRALDHALFEGLRIASPPLASAVAIGADQTCHTIAFADCATRGVAATLFGVDFVDAIGGAWVRGAMAGASGALAARLGADADGCSVTGADLTAIGGSGAKVTVATAHPYRLARNLGSTQQTPLGLGVAATVDFGGTTAVVATSAVALHSTGGGGSASLTDLTGGAEGDLLVLGYAGTGATIQPTPTGNLHLRASPVTLADTRDTLTLVRVGGGWAGLSQSQNV